MLPQGSLKRLEDEDNLLFRRSILHKELLEFQYSERSVLPGGLDLPEYLKLLVGRLILSKDLERHQGIIPAIDSLSHLACADLTHRRNKLKHIDFSLQ